MVKNVHHCFQKPKVQLQMFCFVSINRPQPKVIQLTIIKDWRNQKILNLHLRSWNKYFLFLLFLLISYKMTGNNYKINYKNIWWLIFCWLSNQSTNHCSSNDILWLTVWELNNLHDNPGNTFSLYSKHSKAASKHVLWRM